MAHSFSANSPDFLAQHQDNIMASLAHRLEVAKATNNRHLVELLEQEKKQIAADVSPDHNALSRDHERQPDWVQRLKGFVQAIAGTADTLQVSEFVNGSDRWWYAFDPQTGNCVYADSEAEMRLWIEQNYQGK